ncbi:PREDICTED: G-protein coupled receptor Mth2-like [Wasmannia auropunctata]|uniref:G-protein coupled receptor Mth2-like n=1 Tax=Wasmannia auropunctata TaxID=64793 RepID=UPI0005EE3C13|nr:PREDICTED: G-protein coupled receptor Mth2-like [Wasmannia auropunctata]
MRRHNHLLWCCTLLFVVCSSKPQGNSTTTSDDERNSTVRYGIRADVTANHSDDTELMRYKLPGENFTRNNDESRANSTSDDYEDNDLARYEFHAHFAKDHEDRDNQMSMELRAYSTKADDKDNSTSWNELRGNLTEVEGTSNLTLYELSEKFYEDDNKRITVPYEMCENITCIPLCCPLGSRLIESNRSIDEECVPGKYYYPFPDVYEYATSEWRSIGKKLDQFFSLTVRDPCINGRYPLNPEMDPKDEYVFLVNGSLYQPNLNEFVNSYCLAVLQEHNSYVIAVCFKEDIVVDQRQENSIPVGLLVSLPFLLATFVVYSVLPELWNMHGYTLRGYVGSLFVAYTSLAIVQLTPTALIPDSACIAIAFIIHFSFLASFFWLNVMCFDIWWTFGGFRSLQGSMKQRERKKFLMYSIYAWGSASLLSIICAIMDFVPSVPKELIRPEIGESKCWFHTDEARAIYFYGPMSVTVICNICLFISTALKIVRHKKDTAHHLRGSESRRHDDNKQWFNLYLKLFIVMGINWSMEIISWLFKTAPAYVWYLTDLTNTLQGLIIFIIFVWKDKIKRLLLKRFGCQDRGLFSRNSTRSGCHSSASRTCTTTSAVMSLQEKVNPYVQTNCRAKSLSDEADT